MSVVGSTLAVASAALGVGLLRASWARRGGGQWLTTTGWLAFLGGAVAWHLAGLGWDEAIAFALLGPSLIAFLVLTQHAAWSPTAAGAGRARRAGGRVARSGKLRRGANSERPATVAPSTVDDGASPSTLGRGTARTLLAGPVALAAALGLTALVALRAPWVEANRLVTAGFLLPIAWAGGAIWATMDSRPTRVAVALCLTAIVCIGGAAA